MNEFHSGGGAAVGLYEGTMNFADISSTGDLIRCGQALSDVQGSMDWASLERVLNNAARQKKILILKLWVCNFETVTQSGVKSFITRLNNDAKNLNTYVIWVPAWEFNQPADWGQPQYDWGLGTAGSPRMWYIPASTYVSQMKMIRSVRDSLGAQNVLIGSQPDSRFRYLYPNWSGTGQTGQSTLVNYKDGIAQADVIGCSMYVGTGTTGDTGLTSASIIQAAFDWMHKIHDYIDPTKPFINFEYNSQVPQGVSHANTFFIQNTYAQIPANFAWGLRGLVWWCPFTSSSARTTCNNYASQYEGYKSSTSSQKDTNVAFTLIPNPAGPGQTVTMSGTLKDANSNPISSAQIGVDYSTNGGATWIAAWTLNTNTVGAFSNTFTEPSVGAYIIRASYAGSTMYNPSSYMQTLTVQDSGKVNTQISFGLSPNPANRGATVKLSGTLKNVNSNPVYPAQVRVDYSTNGGGAWTFAWTLNTNSAGAFSKTFTSNIGTYLIRISYAGSASYNPSSNTQTLKVQ